jgi:hypothetical protein
MDENGQLSFGDEPEDELDEDEEAVRDTPHARDTDPVTSHQAADHIEKKEGTTKHMKPGSGKHTALRLIAGYPRTAQEVGRASGVFGLWRRVSDLKLAGLVEVIGYRRDLETHMEGEICQATERGLRVLRELDAGREATL